MNVHEGSEIGKSLKESSYSLTEIVKRLKISKTTFYRCIKCKEPSSKLILALKEILACDICTGKMKEIKTFKKAHKEVSKKMKELVDIADEIIEKLENSENKHTIDREKIMNSVKKHILNKE